MNRVRNVHSPSGMGYSLHNTHLVYLKDCPVCKYGTIDKKTKDGKTIWVCADCQWVFAVEEIEKMKGTK